MSKIVCYNGGTMSYYACSEPTELVVGKEYQVIAENDRGWQTDYELKGVKGYFNSVWFNEVHPTDAIYMALAHTVPIVGKRYECAKLQLVDGQPRLMSIFTGTVKSVYAMGNNIYRVETKRSTYIIQVG